MLASLRLENLKPQEVCQVGSNLDSFDPCYFCAKFRLEKKGIHAPKSYLAIRPESIATRVFLNYQGEPISERGIRKLVVKYRKEAGITKKASCHTLRHTFATYKAEKGVSPFQLQQWLGHANLNTTQIYVHLGKQNAKKIMQDTNL